MTALVFVDTNIFVYARDARDPEKQARASEWLRVLWEKGNGRVSAQVLQEYYTIVTRKLRPGMPDRDARADVRALLYWLTAVESPALLEGAWSAQDQFGLSFWDALIISAAQASSCRFLITEDLQGGQDLGGILVVNPFRTPPEVWEQEHC